MTQQSSDSSSWVCKEKDLWAHYNQLPLTG